MYAGGFAKIRPEDVDSVDKLSDTETTNQQNRRRISELLAEIDELKRELTGFRDIVKEHYSLSEEEFTSIWSPNSDRL